MRNKKMTEKIIVTSNKTNGNGDNFKYTSYNDMISEVIEDIANELDCEFDIDLDTDEITIYNDDVTYVCTYTYVKLDEGFEYTK